jgi:hypothetical protein
MSVRCKFVVSSVELFAEPKGAALVKMRPVYRPKNDGSNTYYENSENEAFGKSTPSGEFTAFLANPDAAAQFQPGQEWYIDLTPVASGEDA